MSVHQSAVASALPAPRAVRARRSGLVQIVRDFISVHREMKRLFAEFRDGSLAFVDVRSLVADGESSVLYRLKERVHSLYRDETDDSRLQRGEALFDLAVGSLFHEALKFRENFYQLEVYGPKVMRLRSEAGEDAGDASFWFIGQSLCGVLVVEDRGVHIGHHIFQSLLAEQLDAQAASVENGERRSE